MNSLICAVVSGECSPWLSLARGRCGHVTIIILEASCVCVHARRELLMQAGSGRSRQSKGE